jgi:transposase
MSLDDRIARDHPLRVIRGLADGVLAEMHDEFERLYARKGRPSIAPERLLKALLLQAFFSVRSERQLMEQLDYNLLFRWFVGLELDEPVWHATAFSKNRDRLLAGDVAQGFLHRIVSLPQIRRLMSSEHFSVDGTLIDAWASLKSFRPKDEDGPPPPGRNAEVDWHGETRSNETHASRTDADAKLYRKGHRQEAKLRFMGHLLMENRNGLIVDARLTQATGTAERDAALAMIAARAGHGRLTLGADKAYYTHGLVAALRERRVTPHIAVDTRPNRRPAFDGRTTRHAGYIASLRVRKRIEEAFGWIKTIAGQRQTKFRGTSRVAWAFSLAVAAYNLVRLSKLLAG